MAGGVDFGPAHRPARIVETCVELGGVGFWIVGDEDKGSEGYAPCCQTGIGIGIDVEPSDLRMGHVGERGMELGSERRVGGVDVEIDAGAGV